jgi:hypothetical protein
MDALEAAHRRLYNQHLSGAPLADPVAVVGWFGAVQAQEYALAKWSLGQRTSGYDDAAVQRLVDAGAILRTHALRPTWHFVAGADLGWIQSVTAPRVHAMSAYYYRQQGIDDDLAARTATLIAAALRGGNHLTRRELGEMLGAAGIEASGLRLAYIVMRAELDGLIANGVMRGKQHTYALVSERVSAPVTRAPDEALAELTRRYFTAHGPATVKDFSWWSSLTVTQIRRGLELCGSALVREEIDGRAHWMAPSGPPPRDAPSRPPAGGPPHGEPREPAAHVLQAYDEYIVAYTESRPIANIAGLPIQAENDNMLIHAIVVDSQVIGYWRRVVERTRIVAQLSPAISVTARQRAAVAAAFARYAQFTGTPVEVAWPAPP